MTSRLPTETTTSKGNVNILTIKQNKQASQNIDTDYMTTRDPTTTSEGKNVNAMTIKQNKEASQNIDTSKMKAKYTYVNSWGKAIETIALNGLVNRSVGTAPETLTWL